MCFVSRRHRDELEGGDDGERLARANASLTRVAVARRNGLAVVEVADDGIGGADVSAGSGLRGLADCVHALDGRLEIVSAPGEGTCIRALFPIDETAVAESP